MKRWQMWVSIVAVLAIFANCPSQGGTLKPQYWQAGFPFIFAWWWGEEFTFHLSRLAMNVLVWMAMLGLVGVLAARRFRPRWFVRKQPHG